MYGTLSPACVDAKLRQCAAQCTPIADGVIALRCVTTPLWWPTMVAAPSVPMPLIFAMSSPVNAVYSYTQFVILCAQRLTHASTSGTPELSGSTSGCKASIAFKKWVRSFPVAGSINLPCTCRANYSVTVQSVVLSNISTKWLKSFISFKICISITSEIIKIISWIALSLVYKEFFAIWIFDLTLTPSKSSKCSNLLCEQFFV